MVTVKIPFFLVTQENEKWQIKAYILEEKDEINWGVTMDEIHMKIAHDGGNGYMKDAINGQRTIFPSVLSRILPGNEPSRIDLKDKKNVVRLINDYLNFMDVEISSNSIKENGRYFVGNLASNSGAPLIGFNVNSNEGKASSDVSLICLLALISYSGIKDVLKASNKIPNKLEITVDDFVTALPIDEIKIFIFYALL